MLGDDNFTDPTRPKPGTCGKNSVLGGIPSQVIEKTIRFPWYTSKRFSIVDRGHTV